VAGALLVANEDMAKRRRQQGVVGGQDRASWQAEDHVHALLLEAADEGLGSGQLHGMLLFFTGRPTKNLLAVWRRR
jgi:hypothetical protein